MNAILSITREVHAISLGKREKRKSSARETLSLYPKIAESNREIIKTTGTEDTKKGTFFPGEKYRFKKEEKECVFSCTERLSVLVKQDLYIHSGVHGISMRR